MRRAGREAPDRVAHHATRRRLGLALEFDQEQAFYLQALRQVDTGWTHEIEQRPIEQLDRRGVERHEERHRLRQLLQCPEPERHAGHVWRDRLEPPLDRGYE